MDETNTGQSPIAKISLPVTVPKTPLKEWLNDQMEQALFQEKIEVSGFAVKISRSDTADFSVSNNLILLRLPLKIALRRDFLLGEVAANGEMVLFVKVQLNLSPDWNLTTRTEVSRYEWVRTPNVSMMGVKLPVKLIAEQVLEFGKQELTTTIDQQIKEHLLLQQWVQQNWAFLQQPQSLSDDFPLFLHLRPVSLTLSPLDEQQEHLKTLAYLESRLYLSLGQLPKPLPVSDLIPVKMEKTAQPEALDLKGNIFVQFSSLGNLLLDYWTKNPIRLGQQTLQPSSILVANNEGQLQISMNIKTGERFIIQGIPLLEENTQQLQLQNLQIEIATEHLQFSPDSWSLTGVLKGQLHGILKMPLEILLRQQQEQINQQLSSLHPTSNLHLTGKVNQMIAEQLNLVENGLDLSVHLTGLLRLTVRWP